MADIIIGRSERDIEKYGAEGTIFVGKQYIKMGESMSLANKVLLDVVRPHVILIAGKRGEGKSYTMAQFAEGISDMAQDISQNVAPLFLDTLGIFWTMKQPNYRDEDLLAKWGLEPKGLTNVKLFVPGGKYDELASQGIPVDEKFYITTSDIDADEWSYALGLDATSDGGILISRVINRLRKKKEPYDIPEIVKEIEVDDESEKITKSAVKTRFETAKNWGLFAKEWLQENLTLHLGSQKMADPKQVGE